MEKKYVKCRIEIVEFDMEYVIVTSAGQDGTQYKNDPPIEKSL